MVEARILATSFYKVKQCGESMTKSSRREKGTGSKNGHQRE